MILFNKANMLVLFIFIHSSLMPQNNNEIYFADLHNSCLLRCFESNGNDYLEDDRFPLNLNSLITPKIIIASLCIPRFNLSYYDSVSINDVIKFYKRFKNNSISQYKDVAFANNNYCIDILSNEKTLIFFSLEGTHLFNGNINWVDSLYNVGICLIGIGHHFENEFLNSNNSSECYGPPRFLSENTSLTNLGKELIEHMISRDILIDVSHLPENVFWQIVEINSNRSPLVASHSNVRALCDTSRNLSDIQILAIAKSKGLIGVCCHSPFISIDRTNITIHDLVDHIKYIVNLIGDDYVSIGTDFEGRIKPPIGFSNLNDTFLLIDEMRRRNFSEETINKIMWKNIYDLFYTWKYSHKIDISQDNMMFYSEIHEHIIKQ